MARIAKPKMKFTLSEIVTVKAGVGKGKGFSVDQKEYHFTSAIGNVIFSPAVKAWCYHLEATGTVTKKVGNQVLDAALQVMSDDVNVRHCTDKGNEHLRVFKVGFEVEI